MKEHQKACVTVEEGRHKDGINNTLMILQKTTTQERKAM